jgi:hypothetical protein
MRQTRTSTSVCAKLLYLSDTDGFAGSTHVYTPESFVSDLARLDRSGPARSQPQSSAASTRPPPEQAYQSERRGTPSPQPPREQRNYAPPAQDPRQAQYQQRPPQAPQSYQSNGRAEPSRAAYPQQGSSSRDPRMQPPQGAPRPSGQSVSSVASQDFVPQIRAPAGSSLQPPQVPHGIKHSLSASSASSDTAPEKKKKGLFGRLK